AGLGAQTPEVCGNIKFDVSPAAEKLALGEGWRQAIGRRQASRISNSSPSRVLVPRHPQRFAEVAALLGQQGWAWQRRSEGLPTEDVSVWLGDSMGEMAAYYRLADLAFVGGSLLPLGGQNLIEAAACDCPVIVGQHTFNFLQATDDAITVGAACRISDVDSLAERVGNLLANPEALSTMRRAAGDFARAHRGATRRTLAFIAQWTDRAGR
ncbi:MAG: glycosyltransferase, partial [Dechloromonas sp.]